MGDERTGNDTFFLPAGTAGPMAEVARRLSRVASFDTTVLVSGESGTGKELAARFLHARHPQRCNGPFISVHCGAIPETLLENELFGHVKGAFTGADRDRPGRFEQADGGTLFLDEIGTMKPEAQVRLLRVLQERTVTRLGSQDARAIDVRVVAATNHDLRSLITRGEFREDLYYRLAAFPVTLPPLRERVSELRQLVESLSARIAVRLRLGAPKRFTSEALRSMAAYRWPGNVRELENTIECLSVMATGDAIDAVDLPEEITGAASARNQAGSASGVLLTEEGLSLRSVVSGLERDLILQSLQLAAGNKARAADLLDLKRTTFLEKLRRIYDEEGLDESHLERSSMAPDRFELTA